jgi:glycosyltransferase involved in cell wall biosynthesis
MPVLAALIMLIGRSPNNALNEQKVDQYQNEKGQTVISQMANNPPVKFILIGALAKSLILFRAPLLEGLGESGWEVHAAANAIEKDVDTMESLKNLNVTPHSIPIKRTGMNVVTDIQTLISMVRVFRKVQPQAILGYTIKPVIWGVIAAWIVGVPRRYAMITGLGYAFTGQATGRRRVIQALVRTLYRAALSRATGIFFQNPDDAALFKELGLLPAGVPVTIVDGSGVDLRHYKPHPLPAFPLRFLLIARLLGDKGVREYAEAASIIRAQHPDVEFHLVGGMDPNPDAISAEDLGQWLAGGAIVYHGEQSDVRPFLADCHVYVLPSYREGTPRTVLEAMATGRAIITTDVPGCRETVTPGVNGLLISPRDSAALVSAMQSLIDDPAKIGTMAKAGHELVRKRYAADKVVAKMLAAMDV